MREERETGKKEKRNTIELRNGWRGGGKGKVINEREKIRNSKRVDNKDRFMD